eukprot:PhF_6_TR8626/c0_g1_i2/m.13463
MTSHSDPETQKPVPMTKSLLQYVSGQYDTAIIQTLSLPNMGIQSIDCLEECTMLTYLDLSGNKISSLVKNCCSFESLGPTLRYLDLSANNLTSAEPPLQQLKCLEVLKLHNNKIDTLESILTMSAALLKLRRLQLTGNPFVTQNPKYREPLFQAFKNIRGIDGEYFSEVGTQIRKTKEQSVALGDDDVTLPPSKPWLSDGFFDRVLIEPNQLILSEEKNFRAVMNEMKRLLEKA